MNKVGCWEGVQFLAASVANVGEGLPAKRLLGVAP